MIADWVRENVGPTLVAFGILLGLSAVQSASGFREDELECEETMAKLYDCCGRDQLAEVRCDYVEGCEYSTYPDLSPPESRCIRSKSCAAIREMQICEQVAERAAPGVSSAQGLCQ